MKDALKRVFRHALAEVYLLGVLPDSEIGEIALLEALPDELTYPAIQPHLYTEALRFLEAADKEQHGHRS